ncbi:MAG: phospholipid carrier-dependent glycosyltransferase [Frankiales bacterium]|nr:phospholipid carrier-dependent glycosyltransferase [Frankiales bacterium]
MTATREAAAASCEPSAAGAAPWRTRILPPTDGRGGWLAALGIGLLAGLLRFVRLDIPAGRIFDELYYACDAQNLLRFGVEVATETDANDGSVAMSCTPTGQPGFIVHPPLGKWAIALGIRLFGVTEFGWRFSAAVAGTIMVVVLVRVTRRMTGSTVLGCLAGLLLAVDGLHFVQSRVAMLDIFLAAWVLGAFACLVADRDAVRRRLAAVDEAMLTGWGPRLGLRPWRIAAGVCLGAGLATKWSAVYYAVVLVLLSVAWEVGARRTAGIHRPVRATLLRTLPGALPSLLVLPLAVYVSSWAGWFLSDQGWDRQWAETAPSSGLSGLLPEAFRSLVQYHREIFTFHDGLSTSHPYQSHPSGWLLLARPVSYYYPAGVTRGEYGCAAESCAREVLSIGTPAIWWASIPMLLALVWLWVSRRDWRAGAVALLVLTAIVPWVRDDLDGRTMFLFYVLPAAPFVCLGLALVAGWAVGGAGASSQRRRVGTFGTAVYVGLVVLNFAWFYPVLAAQALPYAEWLDRMWLSSWI